MSEPEATPAKEKRPKRRKRFRRWILIFLGVLVIGLLWLNGPGLRLIVPKVAVHFLEKAGIEGNFKVGGSLTGGLSFSDLTIRSDGTLANLAIDKITPEYQLSGLVKGKLQGLTIEGVHVDLKLDAKKMDEQEKPPLDLKALVETIRSARSQVLPLNLALNDLTLTAASGGETKIQLDSTRLVHLPGSQDIQLDLGAITDATGRKWEASKSTIRWNPDDLTIERLDPLPGVSLREFAMQLPEGGEPSVDARLHLDDAVFAITAEPGFTSAQVDLREGKLQVDETVKRFGIELPAKATLISLAVDVTGILPDAKKATGSVRVSLDNVSWQDWKVPEISLDAQLGDDQASVVTRGMVLGSAISLDASVPVTRDEATFTLGQAKGKFKVEDIPAVVRELAPRVPAIDPEAPVPPSSLDGNFAVSFDANKPVSADADLVLQPSEKEQATAIALKGHWALESPVTAEVNMDGLKLSAVYQIEPSTYQGTLELDEFTNTRIDRWLAVAKVKAGGVANLTGKWSGDGKLKEGNHRGQVSFTQANWSREDAPDITAIGGMKYDWPGTFSTEGVRVQMNDQTVALEAALGDGLLQLKHFLWSAGKDEMAEGSASLPVPEDFSKWKETLAKDARPVNVAINSRVLPLARLKDWVPALEKLDPKSTGQLNLNISGTYSEPVVDAKLEALDLRSPTQPSLPPADLKVALTAEDGRITLAGNATAPDFAPAEIKATMPFRPAKWAETPELIREEAIEARVDLPRLDLSRFASLMPVAEKVAGILTGNVVVAGTVGKPEILGTIDLADAGVRFKADKFLPSRAAERRSSSRSIAWS